VTLFSQTRLLIPERTVDIILMFEAPVEQHLVL
jgi:hypothetical protein